MKKAMMLVLAVLFLAIAPQAYAMAPYVALFGDTLSTVDGVTAPGGQNHSLCSVYVPAPYTDIAMYVWWMPDASKRLAAVEFKITYPTSAKMIQGAVTSNPINQVELGSLPAGISVSIGEAQCTNTWYWSHWQDLTVKVMTAMTVQVVGHPGNGGHIYVASCELGFPLYDATVLNHLAINSSCSIGTKDASWGAIKNLYNE